MKRLGVLVVGACVVAVAATTAALTLLPKQAAWPAVGVGAAVLVAFVLKMIEAHGSERVKDRFSLAAARNRVRAVAIATDAKGELTRIDRLDPVALGVHRAAVVPGAATSSDLPPYVSRDFDADLDGAIRDGGLVLLEGPSAAGKTRAAVEALRRVRPKDRLLVPRDAAALVEVLASRLPLRGVVVWLDDLERFLQAGGLDGVITDKLTASGAVIVATLRAEERAALDLADGRDDPTERVVARSSADVLRRARRITVDRAFTPAERERAERRRDDPRIADALDHAGAAGIPEHLAAGPAALDLLTAARHGAHLAGAAVVDAVIDCRRLGHRRPVPVAFVERAYLDYVDPRERAGLPPFDDAVTWACRHVRGATSLLTATPAGYEPFDYLVDHRQSAGQPIPDHVGATLLTIPDLRLSDVLAVGRSEEVAGRPREAEVWFRRAAQQNSAAGMTALGNLLRERGDVAEAEAWYRKAATEQNSPAGMARLGNLLRERGDVAEAEAWYRKAATEHDAPVSMWRLGDLLREQGDVAEAETWYRKAATDHNAPVGMWRLASLLQERGDVAEAETWYREAATEHDSPVGMWRLANLLRERGDVAEAETWYRKAATDHDDPVGMCRLADSLRERGEVVEADTWYRRAATERNDPVGMWGLADLLREQGDVTEAETWYRRSADRGSRYAMTQLIVLLREQGRTDEAAEWRATYERTRPDA